MKCQDCNAEVEITAKFCPSCGAKITALSEGKSPQEVNVEWLQEIFEHQKFDVEKQESNANSLICKAADDGPNYIIEVKHNIGIITVQSVWLMKNTTGWGKKKDVLAALNKANSSTWIGIYSISDDTLVVSSHINLTEQITERDIFAFLDVFETSQLEVIKSAGLIDFS